MYKEGDITETGWEIVERDVSKTEDIKEKVGMLDKYLKETIGH